jgi:hypothetical protein
MQQLTQARPLPKDLEALAATRLLEAWRLALYGPGILSALRGEERAGALRPGGEVREVPLS